MQRPVIVSLVLAASVVAGCQSVPAPNDSSTRILNEMKTKPVEAAKAADPRDGRINELERERQRLTDALAVEQQQRAGLERELAEARNKATALEGQAGRATDLERQLAGTPSSEELVRAQQQLSVREQEIVGLRGQLAGVASAEEFARAQQQLSARDQELAALQAKLAGAASADELTKAMQRVTELQEQLSVRDQEIARLKGQLAGMVSADELTRVKQRTGELEGQLSARERELAAQMEKLKEAQRGLGKALRKEVEKGTILVDLRQDHLLVNLASSMLFASGEDALKPEGAEALKVVGGILKDYPEYHVEIGGHTDSVDIKGELAKKFPTNKELSEARAASALNTMQDGEMINSAATKGYADKRPVASNATADGRQKNRRVEVKVTPK